MSQFISIFDMLKIGVGPSSSHTLGPWRSSQQWIKILKEQNKFNKIDTIKIDLYGSLSLTGIGHATDLAVLLGLSGTDPEYIPVEDIDRIINIIKETDQLNFNNEKHINFKFKNVIFNKEFLPFHSNGLTYRGFDANGNEISTETYYSIGGGFVIQEDTKEQEMEGGSKKNYPFPISRATDLEEYCKKEQKSIPEIVIENEKVIRTEEEIDHEIKRTWETMLECMYIGCHTEGKLPGGLNVKRRAFETHKKLIQNQTYTNYNDWIPAIRKTKVKFREILKWVSCFALAVNEVNASLGRVVTAPTNGSSGVIPAVIMYYLTIEDHNAGFEEIKRFFLVAGEIGAIFKKNATISAAAGGCQAEIGVSSAMAAAGLTELLGGSANQCMIAAEIAMEHHLGMTCDPIGGLVQIPCIERNAMGAIKAINAAELALETDPKESIVPLDKVIDTMWETAQDMDRKYKETSEGGLATKVSHVHC